MVKYFWIKKKTNKIFYKLGSSDSFRGTAVGLIKKRRVQRWSIRGTKNFNRGVYSLFFNLYEKKFYKRKKGTQFFLNLRYLKGTNALVNFFSQTGRKVAIGYKHLTKRSQVLLGRLILFRHGLYFRRLMQKRRLILSKKMRFRLRKELLITKSNEITLKDIRRVYFFFYHFFFKLPLAKLLKRVCAYDFVRSGLLSPTFGMKIKLERMSSLFKTTFIFVKIIKYRLMQYYFIGSILSRLVNKFRRRYYRRFQFNEFFKEGLYLRYAGRFTKKLRAWYTIERVGVVTFRNSMAPIDYSAFRLRTRFGTGNIVLALNYKTKLEFKNYSDFKYLASRRK